MTNHLPECPAPLCDWGDPSAKCMGYEDCHHLCCCAALRACEQRVEEVWSAIAGRDQYAEGYAAALDAAQQALATILRKSQGIGDVGMYRVGGGFKGVEDPTERGYHSALRHAVTAIDALREKP